MQVTQPLFAATGALLWDREAAWLQLVTMVQVSGLNPRTYQ